MLKPTKHNHPDQTVLAASTILLRELRKNQVITYDDLKTVLAKKNRSVEFLFTPSLSLLFLVGLVEYLPKVDSFEYVGKR